MRTQVVLMTGYADAVPDAAGETSVRMLNKPFHADDLRRAVSEVLRGHWARE